MNIQNFLKLTLAILYSSIWLTTSAQTVNPPKNSSPAEGKAFTEKESNLAILFSWTPITPKPTDPVTYRVKVWQLKQGQNATTAMANNTPVATQDVVDANELVINKLKANACRPAYQCTFVWNVQAISKQGSVLGSSKPTSFFLPLYIIQLDSLKISCTDKPGHYSFSIKVTNVNTTTAKLTNVAITSCTPAGATISFLPALNTPILSGSSLLVTGTVVGSIALSNICIGAEITDVANSFWKASLDMCIGVPLCTCTDCKNLEYGVANPSVSLTNVITGAYTATGTLTLGGIPAIYGIEMQVQSYNYTALPSSCSYGVTNIANSGVFVLTGTTINGLPVSMLNETISGLGSSNNGIAKNIKLTSTTPLPTSLPFNLIFGLPTSLPGLPANCCKLTYTICLKIRVYYDLQKCNSCTFSYCFPVFTN